MDFIAPDEGRCRSVAEASDRSFLITERVPFVWRPASIRRSKMLVNEFSTRLKG